MKIVVVSDTHMPRMAKRFPQRLVQELENADLILHAGDWTTEQVYRELAQYGPIEGVAGNNDGEPIAAQWGHRKIIRSGDIRIGLIHGHSANARMTAEQTALRAFTPGETDIVVFGHSHIPVYVRHNGLVLFNPGSPTDKRRQKRYSFGILEVIGKDIAARHVFYDNKE